MALKYSGNDDAVDPETGILRNKLEIRVEAELESVEAEIVFLRTSELAGMDPLGCFDLDHLKAIHRHLFGDLYAWAGEIRTVALSKGNSTFAAPRFIEPQATRIFAELQSESFLAELTQTAMIHRLAYYTSELNALHPFREGNGRALREWIRQLALRNDYQIIWSEISQERMVAASIRAFHRDLGGLESLFEPNIFKRHDYDEYGCSRERVFVPKGVPEWKKAPASLEPHLSNDVREKLSTLDELEHFIQIISEKAKVGPLEGAHLRLAASEPAKKLLEEVWPWFHFLRAQSFGKTCRFAVQPHGAQADVVLTMETGEEIPVQITVAVEGEQQANRMEALTRNGSVSGNATITKEKEYKTGYILSWRREATLVEPVVRNIAARVENRIKEKDKKGYPPTTWLLVDIEECGFAHWGTEHVNCVINTATAAGKDTCFERIYLLNEDTCWQVK